MKGPALAALLLLGCGDIPADTTCEVATNDGTSVRCFNAHGICYVGLEGPGDLQCNGDDEAEMAVLRDLARGYYSAMVTP